MKCFNPNNPLKTYIFFENTDFIDGRWMKNCILKMTIDLNAMCVLECKSSTLKCTCSVLINQFDVRMERESDLYVI